jgi:hypothetical protein
MISFFYAVHIAKRLDGGEKFYMRIVYASLYILGEILTIGA